VKYLARSTWEVRRAEADDDGDLVVGVFHRKANRDRLHPPLGLRFTFRPDSVHVRRHEVADEPDLAVRMPLAYRVHQALREGAKTASEIADDLGISDNVARALLSRARRQGKVVSLEERRGRETLWGLAAKG
jgi:DNA-directed RNA polymerase specialized sigma24 family protein